MFLMDTEGGENTLTLYLSHGVLRLTVRIQCDTALLKSLHVTRTMNLSGAVTQRVYHTQHKENTASSSLTLRQFPPTHTHFNNTHIKT